MRVLETLKSLMNFVEAPGIENESGQKACTIRWLEGTIRHEGAPGSVSSRASKCSNGGGVGTESSRALSGEYELRDVVEPALARALVLAAEGQRWDVVIQIAGELQARRQSSSRAKHPPHPGRSSRVAGAPTSGCG